MSESTAKPKRPSRKELLKAYNELQLLLDHLKASRAQDVQFEITRQRVRNQREAFIGRLDGEFPHLRKKERRKRIEEYDRDWGLETIIPTMQDWGHHQVKLNQLSPAMARSLRTLITRAGQIREELGQ